MPKFTSVKLGQNNYALWAWEFRLAAQAADVWDILEDTGTTSEENSVTAPTGQPNENLGTLLTAEQIESRHRSEAIIMNQIAKCVDEEIKIKVCSKATAKEMWDCLKTHHQGKSRRETYSKKRELFTLRFDEFRNMAAFLDAI